MRHSVCTRRSPARNIDRRGEKFRRQKYRKNFEADVGSRPGQPSFAAGQSRQENTHNAYPLEFIR